eukprot:368857-Pelagomonas_calceolata.AAC.2
MAWASLVNYCTREQVHNISCRVAAGPDVVLDHNWLHHCQPIPVALCSADCCEGAPGLHAGSAAPAHQKQEEKSKLNLKGRGTISKWKCSVAPVQSADARSRPEMNRRCSQGFISADVPIKKN